VSKLDRGGADDELGDGETGVGGSPALMYSIMALADPGPSDRLR
jgi:hypothetical protein